VLRIQNFCKLWIDGKSPNQPVRANSATLEPEIGYGRYPLAKPVCLQMFP
jgi:hypothetical protein